MTWAYALITALYTLSFVLSRGVADGPAPTAAKEAPRLSPVRDLQLAFAYVWTRPVLMAAMALAFLVNLLAFPFSLGLLPYVAKNIYLTDQTGLGWLGASFAFGGLVGSVVLSSHRFAFRAAQTMVLAGAVWFAVDVLLAFSTHLGGGHGLVVDGGPGAKPEHDAFGGRDAACDRARLPGPCDGHAHAGHLGLAFGFAAVGPAD